MTDIIGVIEQSQVVDIAAAEPLVARILAFAHAHMLELGVIIIVVAGLITWGRRGRG